jgi:hypothetical protein
MAIFRWLVALPLRIFGYVSVIGGLGAGLVDVYRSLAQGRVVLTPLGEIWFAVSPETLNIVQAGIQRGLHPALWDPVMQTLLQLPAWLALFLLAALTLAIGRLIYRPE